MKILIINLKIGVKTLLINIKYKYFIDNNIRLYLIEHFYLKQLNSLKKHDEFYIG